MAEARHLAESVLDGSGGRLQHVRRVGVLAEQLTVALSLGPQVAEAAWLHDVGYGGSVVITGFHSLDGATWLAARGWAPTVVSLVAFHSGAAVEAEQRGLIEQLAGFPLPEAEDLDALDFCDLTTGPDGSSVGVEERISEILGRYPADDPVHRAVLLSRAELVASVQRVQDRLASADTDRAAVGQAMTDALTHGRVHG